MTHKRIIEGPTPTEVAQLEALKPCSIKAGDEPLLPKLKMFFHVYHHENGSTDISVHSRSSYELIKIDWCWLLKVAIRNRSISCIVSVALSVFYYRRWKSGHKFPCSWNMVGIYNIGYFALFRIPATDFQGKTICFSGPCSKNLWIPRFSCPNSVQFCMVMKCYCSESIMLQQQSLRLLLVHLLPDFKYTLCQKASSNGLKTSANCYSKPWNLWFR